MQITKSKFVLAARGVQLDSGVTSPCVPTLSEYIQTWKFAAFNSIFYREFKRGKVNKHNTWDEQPNIDLAMKRVPYRYNLLFIIF
jgi:hypothetical protein